MVGYCQKKSFRRNCEAPFSGAEKFTTNCEKLLSAITNVLREFERDKGALLIKGPFGSGRRTLAAYLLLHLQRRHHSSVSIQCHPKVKARDIFRAVQVRIAESCYLENVDQLTVGEWSNVSEFFSSRRIWLVASVETKLKGSFNDSIFRKNIVIPALRQRREDIPLIASRFARRWPTLSFSGLALRTLEKYNWPGEVKQLVFCVAKVCQRVLASGKSLVEPPDVEVFLEDVPPQQNYFDLIPPQGVSLFYEYAKKNGLKAATAAFESLIIASAIRECSGNYASTARFLKLPVTTLESRVKSLKTHLSQVGAFT